MEWLDCATYQNRGHVRVAPDVTADEAFTFGPGGNVFYDHETRRCYTVFGHRGSDAQPIAAETLAPYRRGDL